MRYDLVKPVYVTSGSINLLACVTDIKQMDIFDAPMGLVSCFILEMYFSFTVKQLNS